MDDALSRPSRTHFIRRGRRARDGRGPRHFDLCQRRLSLAAGAEKTGGRWHSRPRRRHSLALAFAGRKYLAGDRRLPECSHCRRNAAERRCRRSADGDAVRAVTRAARAGDRARQLHRHRAVLCGDHAVDGGDCRGGAAFDGASLMKTAVVVCPGRGTYNKTELGYLARHFPDAAMISSFDALRRKAGQPTLGDLDGAERFSIATHTRGDNASALIYAATLGYYLSIDREAIEIVAITGNSMGWYSALGCAGALSPENGFLVANTMGALIQQTLIGGQLIYPFVNDDWRPRPERRAALLALAAEIDAAPGQTLRLSIDLGGMLVLAGDEAGLAAFERAVEPVQERFPMRLGNHAAFHTSLMAPVAAAGRERLAPALFGQPRGPLIDGRGAP